MVGTNMFSSVLRPETIINKDQRSSFSGPKHIIGKSATISTSSTSQVSRQPSADGS